MYGRLVTVICATCVASAHADPDVIDPHVARANQLFETHEYAKAVLELEAAYATDPKPALLYNIAQARRLGGDCRGAIASYEQFLATHPEPKYEAFARDNIARCRELIGRDAPPPPATIVTVAPPTRPFYRDVPTLALSGGGALLAIAGTVTWLIGRNDARAASSAATYGEFATHLHGGTLQAFGVAGMIGGATLATLGAVRLVIISRRDRTITASRSASAFVAGVEWAW